MLNTIDLMALNAKYHKYRPDVPLKGNVKQWWLFAYNAIIETQIKPKRNQFKWQHIKETTSTRREYTKIYKKELSAKVNKRQLTNAEIETKQVLFILK